MAPVPAHVDRYGNWLIAKTNSERAVPLMFLGHKSMFMIQGTYNDQNPARSKVNLVICAINPKDRPLRDLLQNNPISFIVHPKRDTSIGTVGPYSPLRSNQLLLLSSDFERKWMTKKDKNSLEEISLEASEQIADLPGLYHEFWYQSVYIIQRLESHKEGECVADKTKISRKIRILSKLERNLKLIEFVAFRKLIKLTALL